MTNADKIRSMTDDELMMLLWANSVNSISRFFKSGGEELMDAKEIRDWLASEEPIEGTQFDWKPQE